MRALIRLTTLFFLCAVQDSQYNKTLMNHLTRDDLIKNGYRIKSPIRSVIIGVINKIGRTRSKSPICQSRDDTKSCYYLIITITISVKNTSRTNISSGDNFLI